MKEYRYMSASPEATMSYAGRLAGKLYSGDVVAMHGDLASGKTTFTRGLCGAMGVKEDVTSPTFTLINEYHGSREIYHIDCYRLKKPEEIIYLGLEDYLDREGILLIEWAEIISAYLPEPRMDIYFEYGEGEQERMIRIVSPRELGL